MSIGKNENQLLRFIRKSKVMSFAIILAKFAILLNFDKSSHLDLIKQWLSVITSSLFIPEKQKGV